MLDKLWDILWACFTALIPWVVIMPYERGLLIRLGVFKRELEPGFHWRMPLHIDTVLYDNVVMRTERLAGLSTTTKDGKSVGFDAVVSYKISDLKKALLEVNDLKDAVADSCAGTIGTTLSESTWQDIWHGEALDALTAACRKKGWKWGVEILSVNLAGVALTRNLRIMTGGAGHHPFELTHR